MNGRKRGRRQGWEREKMEKETGVGEREIIGIGERGRERQGWERERQRTRERYECEKEKTQTGMGERTREKIERETGPERER